MLGTFRLWDKRFDQMIYPTTELLMLEQLETNRREQLDAEDIEYNYEKETVYYLTENYPVSTISQLFETSRIIDQSDVFIRMFSVGLMDCQKREAFDRDILTDGETFWVIQFNDKDCGFSAVEQDSLKEEWSLWYLL